jgi:hypothetical protein
MIEIDVYIKVTTALLGVAYPILLQVTARLDSKYSSEHIVGLFNKEFAGIFFKFSLISTLILIVIWSLKLKPLIYIDGLNSYIDSSASILVASSTIILVISFFLYVKKILIYYTPSKFIPYLQSKHSNLKEDLGYFEALSDILILSIKNQQKNETITLSDFFYSAFRDEREKFNDKPVIYPDLYYEIVHKSIEELAILKEKKNSVLEYRTAGGVWLLGELPTTTGELSEKTFRWLWKNLNIAIQYQQDNMILYHWQVSHQFFSYSLKPINEQIDSNFKISNKDSVDKRNKEREVFLEFHYALGGLLTYNQNYKCLRRVFDFTNSHPPKYELLPEYMDEIFKFYFKIRDPHDMRYSWISNKYPFPNQGGIDSDSIIKKWISSYMAILFLRQYTIIVFYTYMHPLVYPQIPKLQSEIQEWISGIDFFRSLVSEHLENSELMKTLQLSFITREWCEQNNKVYPLDFLDTFKEKLQENYENNALNLPLSDSKILKFKESSMGIIELTITKYQKVNNQVKFNGKVDKWYIYGNQMVQDKAAFSENSEVHYMHYDSFLASTAAEKTQEGITETFFRKKKRTYLLKPEDVFKAIEKLKIDKEYIIIGFGFNVRKYKEELNTKGISDGKFKGISFYNFNGSRLVNNSLFILSKSDLPIISTDSIDKKIIQKFSLEKISKKIELYSSVIDLNNTSEEIFKEHSYGKDENEIKKSVLLSLIFSIEVMWKANVDIIQIIEYSKYRQQGLPNDLDEIVPIQQKRN